MFDFTAAEDNELSFKTGEVIEILDDRDKHWWKGRSAIGEGLFPSNFVTLDLSTDPSAKSELCVVEHKVCAYPSLLLCLVTIVV